MDLKPGLSVRIVTDVDTAREKIVAKPSTVHEVNGSTAILAQTDPPILTSMLQKDIVVTYLVKKNEMMERQGFPARILQFIDYRLNPEHTVKAIVVERVGQERPYNIRMSYRATPTGKSGLSMAVNGTPVHVIDISLGGAKVSHDRSLRLRYDMVVSTHLVLGEKTYTTEAHILRTWDGATEGFKGLFFATMEFVNMDRTVEQALSLKIQDIEREVLQKERLP